MATHQKKHIKKRYTNPKELLLSCPEDGELYGQINCAKGDARFEIKLIENNLLVIAKARGALIKGPNKKHLNKNDYVLIQKDLSSNDDKYFIIHKYSIDDIKKLKKSGNLSTIHNSNDDDDDDSNPDIIFDDDIIKKLDEIDINDDFIASI